MKSKKLSIGKYNIESENGFASEKEAVRFIQDRYPELDSETIKKSNIKQLINNANKSGNASKETYESGEASGKFNPKRAEGSEVREDQSR